MRLRNTYHEGELAKESEDQWELS
ncbi:hypothetical protein PMIN01_00649 [Paraphaeosphaeria minitans]|uniref:Uncharacterized protein n=1 Tax=Paraphaeosphaeria minitans TaxID=565426 RepID=A0A9P6GV44_9PLEO|nr:hypothetical protein PMIN01_00649 [Paraphaeosphaeria minitans]